LQDRGVPFQIDEGGGVFYGPKIDIKLKDAIGRTWQGPTVQVDFNLPERFNLSYVAEDGSKKVPVMVHRAVLGSFERFLGALIEHYSGAFPTWLAPVQAIVMSITDKQAEYVQKIAKELKNKGIRVETDLRSDKIGSKIRNAQMQKVPYMLIVGDKEIVANKVAVRHRSQGDLGQQSLSDFSSHICKEIEGKV